MDKKSGFSLRSQIVADVVETCAVRGLMMKSSTLKEECDYSHVPVSIFPTPYPWEHYQRALEV